MPGRMTLQQQLESGVSRHQAGRLAEAERIYRQVLARQPNHPDALHLLGVLAAQAGRLDAAVQFIRRAIAICSTNPSYYGNLGKALENMGQLDEAIAAFRQAIRLKPDLAEVHYDLGVALQRKRQLDEAIFSYRQAIGLKPTLAEAHCNLGNALRDKGQLEEAIASYRQAIGLKPDLAEAHNNLGNAFKDRGQLDQAVASYRQAIRLKPDVPESHGNLGDALMHKGQLDEAIACYRQAARFKPDYADAYCNLGIALQAKGQLDEAIASYRQTIRLKSDHAEAHYNLGIALQAKGRLDEAISLYRQAIRLKPDFPEAHSNLGNALKDKGQLDEAIACHRQAIRLNPVYAEAHNNLGNALQDKRELDEAIAAYRQAIRLKPDYAEAHTNLGAALLGKRQVDEAMASYRQAIGLKPDYADAHNNLGNVLKDVGRLDEAIASYRQAIRLKADFAEAHSNLIYALHYRPGYDAGMIFEEHRRWSQQHAEPLKKFIQPHINNRDPNRPLRIGYVSPDFRNHPVGRFILPLLAAHDADRFEVFCYCDVRRPDHVTGLLRRHASQWRNTLGLTDERAAQLIREDQIDVLVDLTMHTAENRMLLFARKPAPVQVSYLAYCSTTGLDTMDYRLTDPHLDPPGMNDAFYSEKSIRLPETYWCYPLEERSPPVSPPPALIAGEVTFGSLNNFCKVSPEALDLWIQLLRATPKSRLILHANEGSHRQRVRDLLEHQGIDPRRLKFADRVPLSEYYRLYEQIDIGLDPFPYTGGTTTCDALWMGVPVVTLAGRTAVGRGGVSVLCNVGLSKLIAQTPQQYVQIATDLAKDLPRLAELRRALRARMQASPLMDAPRFARNIEAAYRQMWRNWCQ
jgi:predicted O-linked N-acetylglucosamine transferase (SPINDLY family)